MRRMREASISLLFFVFLHVRALARSVCIHGTRDQTLDRRSVLRASVSHIRARFWYFKLGGMSREFECFFFTLSLWNFYMLWVYTLLFVLDGGCCRWSPSTSPLALMRLDRKKERHQHTVCISAFARFPTFVWLFYKANRQSFDFFSSSSAVCWLKHALCWVMCGK